MKSRTKEGLVSVAKERISAATDQISSTSIASRNSRVGNNRLLANDRRKEVLPCTCDYQPSLDDRSVHDDLFFN